MPRLSMTYGKWFLAQQNTIRVVSALFLSCSLGAFSPVYAGSLGWGKEAPGAPFVAGKGIFVANRDSNDVVVIDPVDGSSNAARHLPYWATSICASTDFSCSRVLSCSVRALSSSAGEMKFFSTSIFLRLRSRSASARFTLTRPV